MTLQEVIPGLLASFVAGLDARAAGAWSVADGRLEQLGFEPGPALPPEVAAGFAAATRSVDAGRLDLGIVRAAATGEVVESVAAGLPSDVGSGYWLRAFGATRSVAVPVLGEGGSVALVASVALGPGPGAEVVAGLIRSAFLGLDSPGPGRDNDPGAISPGPARGRDDPTW